MIKFLSYAAFFLTIFGLQTMANPLLEQFNTPYGVPPFDKIKNDDYLPAFKQAMKEHNQEIEAIISNKQSPTFANTIEALEYSGSLLNTVATIFFNINSANTNDQIQEIAGQVAPMLSAHSDEITMNEKLFKKVKSVYDSQKEFNLNSIEAKLLEDTYKHFVREGANLSVKDKETLKEINKKLATLTLKFSQNVLGDVNKFQLVLTNKKDLSGLPQSTVEAAAETAKQKGLDGKWVFTLQNPSVMPFLQYADNRQLRQKMQKAYVNRGNNNNEFDNKSTINQIVNLRLKKAILLGYKSHADYSLEETMAKTPQKAIDLLMKIWEPALEVAKKEAADIQGMMDKEGKKEKLEAWDWRYYAEKVRKARYDLDEEQIKPYLKLENVRDGIFDLTKRLYGITYKELNNVPKYSDEAHVYEVLKEDGSHLGILYMDFFPRDNKKSGAWMTNYREQYYKDGKNITPIVSLVCNFTKPAGDTPSLLTWDEAETFFHEFGHCLHGLFADSKYRSQSGTNVSRDFVELPSQIMEHWVSEPEVLKSFAKHYKTNAVIPDSLINKLQKSSLFNQGFANVEFVASAILDMKYHSIEKKTTIDAEEFQDKVAKEIGLIPQIAYRHGSTQFSHIFSGGYDAGYYSYLWAGVLDSDAFQAFKEAGIYSKETAKKFKDNILSKGNTEDPLKLYIKFRGKEPSIEPLLMDRGLK
ncbi:MAG TPA: M3 family metallopeptidase [Candidatus Kapabacteria bacterium]|nr:M3 family metallopeptidase [Candidatus Kapabacteria bacterium]